MNTVAMEQGHAADWERLAVEADRFAQYEEDSSRFGGAYRNKAQTYRRTAQAIRMETVTGAPHCVCCLAPFKFHGVR